MSDNIVKLRKLARIINEPNKGTPSISKLAQEIDDLRTEIYTVLLVIADELEQQRSH